MRNNVFILILLLFAAPAGLLAQDEGPVFDWESIGPDNMGGRTRALAFTPDGAKLYAGAVGGGLWVSENTGRTWRKVESFANAANSSLAVSYIAIDQDNPNNMYVATGEIGLNFNKQNFSNYGFLDFNGTGFGYPGYSGLPGKGVYVSTDGGETFSNANATWEGEAISNPYQAQDPETGEIVNPWISVQKLTINNNRVFAATLKGLFYTDDNFATVVPVETNIENLPNGDPFPDGEQLQDAIVFDLETTSEDVVYAATDKRVFISRDNGETFTETAESEVFPRVSPADLRPNSLQRLEVAVSASDPNVVYVAEITDVGLNGVWRSQDAGQTWRSVAPPSSVFQSNTNLSFAPTRFQGNALGRYTFTLHVDRNDPDHIYMGSVQWWEYTPEEGWRNTTTNIEFIPWLEIYVPRNQHIVVNHPAREETIVIGTDRQITSSLDGGETFRDATGLYAAASAYSVDVTLAGQVVASTANAGVVLKENTGTRSFRIIQDGSEGLIRASPFNPAHFVSSSSNYQIQRSLNDGDDFTDFLTDNRGQIIGGPNGLNPDSCASDKLNPYPPEDEGLSTIESPGPEFYPVAQFVLDPYYEEGGNVLQNRMSEQVKKGYAYHASNQRVFMHYNPFGETDAERYMLQITPTNFYDNTGAPPNRISALGVSGDEDHVLYIGTTGGELYRVFNAHDPCSEDFAFEQINTDNIPNRWITSINFMPGRADTMVVTLGGYDPESGYKINDNANPALIFATFDAKGDNPEFYTQHSLALPPMPIYDVMFNPENPEEWMLVGTERGIWYMSPSDFKDNALEAQAIDYAEANDGQMAATPVYDFAYHEWGYAADSVVYIKRVNGNDIPVEDSSYVLRVRAKSSRVFEEEAGAIGDTAIVLEHNIILDERIESLLGNIYAATFGLGVFKTEISNINNKVTSRSPRIDENGQLLSVYPNPANGKARIRLDSPLRGEAEARLFSLDGSLIKTWNFEDQKGNSTLELDLDNVPAGAYLIKYDGAQNGKPVRKVGKLVVVHQ